MMIIIYIERINIPNMRIDGKNRNIKAMIIIKNEIIKLVTISESSIYYNEIFLILVTIILPTYNKNRIF